MFRPRSLAFATALAVLAGCPLLTAHVPTASAATFNVCSGCSYSSIQSALNAAHNGDEIHIGPGTFAGGITIAKSVTLIGAGSGSTTIQGGSPVVTIGVYLAASEPTVSISGVTITGGTNGQLYGAGTALGGGVVIVAATGNTTGGTVGITDSVITGNTVAPTSSVPCGSDPQPTCDQAGGAGIYNDGVLTLTNSTVSHNVAFSDADLVTGFTRVRGGGIFNTALGTLTVRHSTVNDNVAGVSKSGDVTAEIGINCLGGGIKSNGPVSMQDSTVSGNSITWTSAAPDPMFAAGGGIDMGAPLTVDGSTISDNSVLVTDTSTDPRSDLEPVGAGVHIGDNASGTIRGSVISWNYLTISAPGGFEAALGGGIDDDTTLLLVDSTVRDNATHSTITSVQPGSFSGAPGGGISVNGSATIRGTTVRGNSSTATGGTTALAAGGGLTNENGEAVSLADSSVTGNSAAAATSSGTAIVWGGAIRNRGTLTLRDTSVSNNAGSANGASGMAQGGGIWNDSADTSGGPPGPPSQLILNDSSVTHNQLTGSPGITPQGGGIYNGAADGATVTATNSVIAQNSPDQCFGC
jgi:hypothetical protein